jgi:hypothetical protein
MPEGQESPNKACAGRLELCAFLGAGPGLRQFLFSWLVLPSRRYPTKSVGRVAGCWALGNTLLETVHL